MDEINLIDLNNDICYKVASPLIPAPKSVPLRLSDVQNNPFDKIFHKILNKNDPFECNLEKSIHDSIIEENKENVGHLISPVQTPIKVKGFKRVSSSPLYIKNNVTDTRNDENPGQLSVQTDKLNFNSDCNVTDTSLQILSDSVLDNNDSFNFASVSSVASKDYDNELNKEFFNENSNEHRRCLSARKPSNNMICIDNTTKPKNLNNSFAGFNYDDRNIQLKKTCENYDDDSVFLEATQLAEVFRTSAAQIDWNDEDISQCSPPWVEENIVFLDEDEGETASKKNIPIVQVDSPDVWDERKKKENLKEKIENNNEEEYQVNSTTDIENKKDIKNAKDLLHNLTAILNNNGTIVDQRQLGESLLNSLALALNIENPNVNKSTENNKSINKLQRSKSDSKVGENSRRSLEKQEIKVSVPKIKTQTAAPVKLDKNLKLRNEKDKVTSSIKGPLKALLPVTNMAKMKKNIVSKISLHNTTPQKQSLHSLYQTKNTSTPNESKINLPIAQSTPEITKPQGTEHGTPISKRNFGLTVSPFSKPASTNDISNVSLNNSISPKHTSGSVPNLNKSTSSSLKPSTNSSIPTVKSKLSRRNSASDMTTSKSNSLNRSYDNSAAIRPSVQLKRSSSFHNKNSIQKVNSVDNNNTTKKYGMPGTLKSLRLVKK